MSEAQAGALVRHLDLLWQWNRKMNLTGLSSRRQLLVDLTLDAMVAVPHIPDRGRLLDVGSGGGFPAIPLKILKPELEIHLVEANRKKAAFLKQMIRLGGFAKAEVFNTRVEATSRLIPLNGYDRVTAKALAPLMETIRWCAPFLGEHGRMILFMGFHAEAALKEQAGAILAHRLRVAARHPYFLPGKTRPRHLVLFAKAA